MGDEKKKGKSQTESSSNGTHVCDLCNISFATDQEMKEHAWSLMHHIKMEHRKKGTVHTCTLCFTTCANLKEYGTHMYLDKHLSAVDQEKQEAQAAMEARLNARSKSPQKSDGVISMMKSSMHANVREKPFGSFSSNHGQHENNARRTLLQTESMQSSNPYPQKVMDKTQERNKVMPLLPLPSGDGDGRNPANHQTWHTEWGSNCIYAGFKSHAYQSSINKRLNMQTDQDRFWQDDVWGWNHFEMGKAPRGDYLPHKPLYNNYRGDSQSAFSPNANSRYSWKRDNFSSANSQVQRNTVTQSDDFPKKTVKAEDYSMNPTKDKKYSDIEDRLSTSERKIQSLKGRSVNTVASDDNQKVKARPKKYSESSSQGVRKGESKIRSLKKTEMCTESNKNSDNKSKKSSKANRDLLEKKISKSANLKKSKMKKQNTNSNDRGAALLEEAEKLCQSLRQKREEARLSKEKKQKEKEREEKSMLEEEINALSDKSKSNITGVINEEACKKYAPSKIFSEAKEADSYSKPSTEKESFKDVRNDEKSKDEFDSIKSDIVRNTSNFEICSSRSLANPVLTKDSNSKALSANKIPHVSFNKTKIVRQKVDIPDKDQLVKLVNAPRSRKERLQLSQMLRSHSKSQQKTLAHPRFGSTMTPTLDSVKSMEEIQSINLSQLPYEVKLQIAELIERDLQPDYPDSGSEIKSYLDENTEEQQKRFVDSGSEMNKYCDESTQEKQTYKETSSSQRKNFDYDYDSDDIKLSLQIKSETLDEFQRISDDVDALVELQDKKELSKTSVKDKMSDCEMSLSELNVLKTEPTSPKEHVIIDLQTNSRGDVIGTNIVRKDSDSYLKDKILEKDSVKSNFSQDELDEKNISYETRKPSWKIKPNIPQDDKSQEEKYIVVDSESPVKLQAVESNSDCIIINNEKTRTMDLEIRMSCENEKPTQIMDNSSAKIPSINEKEKETIKEKQLPDVKMESTQELQPGLEISDLYPASTSNSMDLNSGDYDHPLEISPEKYHSTPVTVKSEAGVDRYETSSVMPSVSSVKDSSDALPSPTSVKRKKTVSPTLQLFEKGHQSNMEFKRPKIETVDLDFSSVGYDSSTSQRSGVGVETSVMSSQPQDCVNQVLELSLQEEAVRTKLTSVNSTIERLNKLLQQTQVQLDRYLHVQDKLVKEEEELRNKRINILKGAVAEKSTPSFIKTEPRTSQHLNVSSPVVIDLCNVKEEVKSPPPDPIIKTLKFEADSTSLDQGINLDSTDHAHHVELGHPSDSTHQVDDISQPTFSSSIKPKEEIIEKENIVNSFSNIEGISKSSSGTQYPIKTENYDTESVTDLPESNQVKRKDDKRKKLNLNEDGILQSCSGDELSNTSKGNKSLTNEHLKIKYVGSIDSGSVTNTDMLKKIALDISADEMGSTSYMFVEENQLMSDQDKVEDQLSSPGFSTDDSSIFKDVSMLSQEDGQAEVNSLNTSKDSMKTTESESLKVQDVSVEFKKPPVPLRSSKRLQNNKNANSETVGREKPTKSKQTAKTKNPVAREVVSDSKISQQPSSSTESDSPVKKRLKSKKQRDMSSSLSSLTSLADDSNSDSNLNDPDFNIPLSELCANRKKRQRKNIEFQILKKLLHADSSSDVEIEGLDADQRKCNTSDEDKDEDQLLDAEQAEASHAADDKRIKGVQATDMKKAKKPGMLILNEFSPRLQKFEGHTMAVMGMQIYDGCLFTCSEDMTARKYDLKTQECQMVYQGHSKSVHCLLVTNIKNLGDRLFTGGFDNLLMVFDPMTGQCLARCRYADKIYSLCEGWNKLFVGLANGIVLSFHPGSNRTLDAFKCSERPITAVAVAREGSRNLLCVASADGVITVRDAQSGLLLRTLEGPTKPIASMQVMKHLVYSGCGDKKLYVHNLNTGELLTNSDHTSPVKSVIVTSNLLITAGFDGMIRLYETKNFSQPCAQVYYGNGSVTSMALHDSQIFTSNKEGIVETMPLCLNSKYKCQWMDCGLMFAWRKHLQMHTLRQHILLTTGRVRCLWTGCSDWINTQNNDQAAAAHMLEHLSDANMMRTGVQSAD